MRGVRALQWQALVITLAAGNVVLHRSIHFWASVVLSRSFFCLSVFSPPKLSLWSPTSPRAASHCLPFPFPAVVSPYVIASESTALITVWSGQAVKHGRDWQLRSTHTFHFPLPAHKLPYIHLYKGAQTQQYTEDLGCVVVTVSCLCSRTKNTVFTERWVRGNRRICQSMSDPPNPQVRQEL